MIVHLGLLPTEHLLQELYSRYHAAVFAGLRTTTAQHEEIDCGYAGGLFTAMGLAVGLADYLKAQRELQALEALEDDDDAGAL